jgi:signal transduction histidine kinase
VLGLSSGLYCLTFLWLFPILGDGVTALCLLPIIAGGWFYGWAVGAGGALLFALLNGLLYALIGVDGLRALARLLPGVVGSIAIGAVAGQLRAVLDQIRAQALALRQERAALMREIAARRQVEADLMVARDAAEVANRAKSVFLANVSHELRTPLTVIMGYTDLLDLQARAAGQADLSRDIGQIRQASEHLYSLINSVLELARLESRLSGLALEPVNIADLVRTVLQQARAQIEGRGNRLDRYGAEEALWVRSDPQRLRRVLLGLLDNAAKFTHNGAVAVGVIYGDASAASGRMLITFEVRDTGVGIPDERLEEIFQPFAQSLIAANSAGGSGLSLAIGRMICRALGGDMTISSGAGGTTVTCLIAAEVIAVGRAFDEEMSIPAHGDYSAG